MRSTGVLALYCCFFASMASLLIGVLGAIFVPKTGLGYFFGSIFLFFPLIPVHAGLIYFFRQIGYNSENIMWSMSALLWATLFLAITQLSANDYFDVMPFVIAIGVSQSFGYIQTFSLKPPTPKSDPEPGGMYSTV